MSREELLSKFTYPGFLAGKRALCLSWRGKVGQKLPGPLGITYRLAEGCELCIGDWASRFDEGAFLLREGDWLGLSLDARGQVVRVLMLAPCRLPTVDRLPLPSRETLAEWALFLKLVRRFFEQKKILEVHTPTLVTCPGTEPFLDPFSTEFHFAKKKTKYYLPTSPEIHLKKMLAEGYGPLFEIRTCFRNGEVSPHHQPEFWMLEWYRPGADLRQIQKDCVELIRFLIRGLKKKKTLKIRETSMAHLFQEHLQIILTPRTSAADLVAAAGARGLSIDPHSDFDDAFYFLFVDQIERKISPEKLSFVRGYPPSQAALARLTSDGWGDRFEMYWQGLELANAYHELNDPEVQRHRSQEDLDKKRSLQKEVVPLDPDFFSALDRGMPPSAGIALGLERLFLCLTNKKGLSEIRPFAFLSEN